MSNDEHITELLRQWRNGKASAFDALVAALYEDVRLIAHRAFSGEPSGHTLQATAVANEALLRVGQTDLTWQDRSHFLAVIARAIRHILVDHARSKARAKRGGGVLRVTLATEHGGDSNPEIIDVHEALEALATHDQRKAHIMELHYFAGMTYDEIGNVLTLSTSTIDREIRFSKAWLKSQLQDG